jgi:UDP-N-acetylmuramoylalanine--D-glutamate ligase
MKRYSLTLSDLLQKRILVAGAGVTGIASARALGKREAEILVVDEKVSQLEGFEIRKPSDISTSDFDILFVSPGWREDNPLLAASRSAGIPIINEIDVAWAIKSEAAPKQKWIALTGTNGKTTTVELTAHMLRTAGISAVACGNVGTTVIESVEAPEKYDYLVLELSSFQLHWIEDAQFTSVAILNIADDHIDWHGSYDAYATDKISILDRATTAILNGGDSEVVGRTAHWLGRKVFYSLDTPAPGEIGVVEELLVDRAFVADPQEAAMFCELIDVKPSVPHQVSNVLAAAGLARTAGVSHESIREAIQSFTPGRHRIEVVAKLNDITFVDDSKATNPHAAAASITSHFSVIWIAGGLAKGADMEPLVSRTWSRLKAAILIGEDRELIAAELKKFAPELPVTYVEAPSDYVKGGSSNSLMEAVVASSMNYAQEGDVVLLAPACASMDQFVSYADRGDRFAQAVSKVVGYDKQ